MAFATDAQRLALFYQCQRILDLRDGRCVVCRERAPHALVALARPVEVIVRPEGRAAWEARPPVREACVPAPPNIHAEYSWDYSAAAQNGAASSFSS